jgi:porin
VWHYTAKFDDLLAVDPSGASLRRGGNTGFYGSLDRQVTAPFDDARGLRVFARVGLAESEINQLSSNVSGGFSYTGPFSARPDDQVGLAFSYARNGKPIRQAAMLAGSPLEKAETNLEFTYRAPLTEWLTVQPDAQWIINPGTDPTLKNAFVVGLRFEIGFGKDL